MLLLIERDRTLTFGAWLNHGTRRQLASLAPFDLACERATEPDSPWMRLIEPDGRTSDLRVELPTHESLEEQGDPFEHPQDRSDQATLKQIDILTKSFVSMLSGGVLERLMAREDDLLDEDSRRLVRTALEDPSRLLPGLVESTPARSLAWVLRRPEPATELFDPTFDILDALALMVRRRYVWRDIPGSRWVPAGCKNRVPDLSKRFLSLIRDDG